MSDRSSALLQELFRYWALWFEACGAWRLAARLIQHVWAGLFGARQEQTDAEITVPTMNEIYKGARTII